MKNIGYENSLNSKAEEYTYKEEYYPMMASSFMNNLEFRLSGHIRRNPCVKKCILECDLIPNHKAFLDDSFNRMLTKKHVNVLIKELARQAKIRYKHPHIFK